MPSQRYNPVLIRPALVLALAASAEPIVLRARQVIDVERGEAREQATIAISGDRIVAEEPGNARVIDLGELTLLPGLIDAHVHLTLAGKAEENARATLLAGFTTVADLGAAGYENLELRDAIASGQVPGPRVVASGPWLGISGGICDFGGIGVRGPEAFRERVRADVARGADLIKVCVSGWLEEAFQSPSKFEISREELSAAIEGAHGLGKRVAVHALSASGIETAIELGADLVVHGGFTPPATVDRMKALGIRQLTTLSSLAGRGPEPAARALRSHLRSSLALGLPLAFGTDAGVIPHGENARELEELLGIGMTAPDALRAATVEAAHAVGLPGQVGTLAPGAFADVIGVEGNPLADPSALRRVRFVMKAGRVFLGPGAR
jgi:imidazolonepropionase-like amidohydrolase